MNGRRIVSALCADGTWHQLWLVGHLRDAETFVFDGKTFVRKGGPNRFVEVTP